MRLPRRWWTLLPGSTPYWLLLDGKTKQDIEIVQGYAGVPDGCDFRDRKPNAELSGPAPLSLNKIADVSRGTLE
jgi:hypothetical protein